MAEYRRWIAAIYSYERGMKRGRAGYARLETYDGELRMRIIIRYRSFENFCYHVYFFKRHKNRLEGIKLGEINVHNGTGEFSFVTPCQNISRSGLHFLEMNGIILYMDALHYFGSQWDEKPITQNGVLTLGKKMPKEEEQFWFKEETIDTKGTADTPLSKDGIVKAASVESNRKRGMNVDSNLVNSRRVSISQQSMTVEEARKRHEERLAARGKKGREALDGTKKEQRPADKEAQTVETAKSAEAAMIRERMRKEEEQRQNEQAKLQQIRSEKEKAEKERLEKEKIEKERLEKEKSEQARLAQIKQAEEEKKQREEEEARKEEAKQKEEARRKEEARLAEERKQKEETERAKQEQEQRERAERIRQQEEIAAKEEQERLIKENSEKEMERRLKEMADREEMARKGMMAGAGSSAFEGNNDLEGKSDLKGKSDLEENRKAEGSKESEAEGADVRAAQVGYAGKECRGMQTVFPWMDFPQARNILDNHPHMYPFEDGEIAECVRIEPGDIGMFPMEAWGLGNNSFIRHAYVNYRHLLFAKKQVRDGCLYLLMVPGVYNPREKHMARMFGFDYFKCVNRKNLRIGEFGYWYIPINFGG